MSAVDALGAVFKDFWIFIIGIAVLVLIVLGIYVLYVQFGFEIQPMLANMSFSSQPANCTQVIVNNCSCGVV